MTICENGFKILARNEIINATLTARGGITTSFEVDNIKHYDRYVTGRWDITAPVVIDIEFDGPVEFDSLSLEGLNLSSTGTVSFQAWREAGQTGELKVDNPEIQSAFYKAPIDIRPGIDVYGAKYERGSPLSQLEMDSVTIIQSAQLIITDASNQDGFIELPHLMAGKATRFESGYLSHTFTPRNGGNINKNANQRAVRGQHSSTAKSFKPTFQHLTKTDFMKLRRLQTDFSGNAWRIYGRPWEPGSIKIDYEILALVGNITYAGDGSGLWSATFDVEEV